MANESANQSKTQRKNNSSSANKVNGQKKEFEKTAPIAGDVISESNAVAADVTEPKVKFSPRDIDPHQIVTVRNGFQGRLVYRSKHTGELFVWDSFGDEQDMELSELRSARSSNKKFFVNNWFMFNEQWIVDYLGMNQYYKFAVSIDDFDNLFDISPDKLEDVLDKLSAGQKKSAAYRARKLIAEGKIDSNRTITTLERCLGVELVDRL